VQDLLHRIKSYKFSLPAGLSPLRYLVFGLLVLLLPYLTGESWFSILCPQGTLSAAIPWALWNPPDPVTHLPLIAEGSFGLMFVIKILILVAFLALFVMVKRPFCRFVCPLGLLLSFFNRASFVRLEVSANCTRCGKCKASCPVDIHVYEDPNTPSCIRCLKCTACPHVKLIARPLVPDLAEVNTQTRKRAESSCTSRV
jgi:ferredoxin-type protein NapH